jgi:hypothetical protein
VWEAELAAVYDNVYAREAEPSVVEPIAEFLAGIAGGGVALELAVGTGRVALALSARGVAVTGIELPPHADGSSTACQARRRCDLRARRGLTTTRAGGSFAVVYLVAN